MRKKLKCPSVFLKIRIYWRCSVGTLLTPCIKEKSVRRRLRPSARVVKFKRIISRYYKSGACFPWEKKKIISQIRFINIRSMRMGRSGTRSRSVPIGTDGREKKRHFRAIILSNVYWNRYSQQTLTWQLSVNRSGASFLSSGPRTEPIKSIWLRRWFCTRMWSDRSQLNGPNLSPFPAFPAITRFLSVLFLPFVFARFS